LGFIQAKKKNKSLLSNHLAFSEGEKKESFVSKKKIEDLEKEGKFFQIKKYF
jgi:hypothetical protein